MELLIDDQLEFGMAAVQASRRFSAPVRAGLLFAHLTGRGQVAKEPSC